MRQTLIVLSAAVVVAGCQTAQQSDTTNASGNVGNTTAVSGTPPATAGRSETTRPSDRVTQGTPSGGVTLTLDRATYARGGTVSMRITNQTADTLGFNQCSSRAIERQAAERWVAHPEPDRMCTMELRLLMPRETQTANTDLPGNLTAGTYRMVLTLGRQTVGGGSVRAVSAPFRVT